MGALEEHVPAPQRGRGPLSGATLSGFKVTSSQGGPKPLDWGEGPLLFRKKKKPRRDAINHSKRKASQAHAESTFFMCRERPAFGGKISPGATPPSVPWHGDGFASPSPLTTPRRPITAQPAPGPRLHHAGPVAPARNLRKGWASGCPIQTWRCCFGLS